MDEKKDIMIRRMSVETHKELRTYAINNDLTVAEAFDRIISEWKFYTAKYGKKRGSP